MLSSKKSLIQKLSLRPLSGKYFVTSFLTIKHYTIVSALDFPPVHGLMALPYEIQVSDISVALYHII